MSESQSRYSIIERLTKNKLEIMTSKSNLIDNINKAEQRVNTLRLDVDHDKKVYDEECAKSKADLDKTFRDAKQDVSNLQERKQSKERLFDEKIRAIDIALKQLEEISKSQS